MGQARQPDAVILFLALTYAQGPQSQVALEEFTARFGPMSASWGPIPFSHTDYYQAEMGAGLLKSYHAFDRPVQREELPLIKEFSNALETRYLNTEGGRIVNLDPGYLSRDKLVLASTKDFFHRLYLGCGIYGEVTLHTRGNAFRFFSWTYPDFREAGLHAFLLRERARLLERAPDAVPS